jgi:multidrug efflux pump subunit AcrA (membrane-fusion protein)
LRRRKILPKDLFRYPLNKYSMQEKLQQFTQKAIAHKNILLAFFLGSALVTTGVAAMNMSSNDSLAAVSMSQERGTTSRIEIAIAGATSSLNTVKTENSWPGELISLGNVPVQPQREGTIAAWNVHIGQAVFVGQVLGTLSASPQMPDTIAMVAEKASEAAMSRTTIEAKRVYTLERITQLTLLRDNTEESLKESQALLGFGERLSGDISMIAAKKEAVRAVLRSTFAKTYPIFSGNAVLPTKWTAISLIAPIGAQNSRLRDQFSSVVFSVQSDLGEPATSPVVSGLAYYDLMIKLADASLPDGGMLTDAMLLELKATLHEGEQAFIMAVDEAKKTELMAVDTKKASFEQLREIDNEIATLKQELAMAEGDVVAKETAYRSVSAGARGASAITAPKSGVVSAIMKQPGEFVGPGSPVALITGGKNDELIVRFRIPSNIRTPEVGNVFRVLRSGFPETLINARLIGVGRALDDTGSVMADALLLDPVSWPIGTSVRIIPSSENDTMSIALSSVWWDTNGKSNIWAVSDGGRVYAKKVLLGRTLGETIEVDGGLVRGERYVVKPTSSITEDMLVDDISSSGMEQQSESSYEAAMRAMGM